MSEWQNLNKRRILFAQSRTNWLVQLTTTIDLSGEREKINMINEATSLLVKDD